MSEFWEKAFKEKHLMWGEQPTRSAIMASEQFTRLGFRKILIPGFGYGRNAKPFIDKGLEVVGIEISETAIKLAQQFYGENIRIHHGSVSQMPFDQEIFDGIFCHALIHLLRANERKSFLESCFSQVKKGGVSIFTAITKHAPTFGVGEMLGKDHYKTKDDVELFFYDEESIKDEFGAFGLEEAAVVEESSNGAPTTKFWNIILRKQA